MTKRLMCAALLILLLLLPALSAFGEQKNEEIDTDALIELLKKKGVLSEQEAEALKKRPSEPQPAEEPATTIPAEQQKIEIKKVEEEIKRVEEKHDRKSDDLRRRQRLADRQMEELERRLSDLNAKAFQSEWARRIRFGGDIRLRYQGDFYDNNNALLLDPNDPDTLLNTTNDTDQYRYRVRLAMTAKIIDPREINVGKVEAGLRLTTGNEKNPVSTNDTLGDYFNKDGFVLDRAYLRWTYSPYEPAWGNNIPQVMLTGGRIPNPWYYTPLVWDDDINFEGIAVNFITDTQDFTKVKGFLAAGAFPLQEDAFNSDCDKYLFAGQVGIEYTPRSDIFSKLGLAYYDYYNTTGEANEPDRPNENDCSAPLYLQKGNTLFDIDPGPDILPALASDYNIINLTGKIDLGMYHPIHIVFEGDYAENIGFDRDEVEERVGEKVDEETTAYSLGIEVGHPRMLDWMDWNIFLNYRYIEADAVFDAFNDSDFHGGGTNAKGWLIGGKYGLYRNVWLQVKWYTTDEISGPQLSIDTLQMDMNARF
jgi:hypothetical protein